MVCMHSGGDLFVESVCIVCVCIGWDVFTGERTGYASLHRGGDTAIYIEDGIGSYSQSRGQQ